MNNKRSKKIIGMMTYSTGDVLGGGVGQVISLYYFTYLTFVAGLSPILAGLVTGIGKVWDGVTDPVMGVIVDRTKTKYGSCRPYFLLAIIPVFISYFLLWNGWGIQGEIAKFFYFTFAYMFFSTAYTLAIVPYEALLPKMVDSYSERTDYSSMRMIFSGVGCVASTYIYEWLIPSGDGLNASMQPSFTILAIVLGAFFSLPLLITFFGTKEKPNTLKLKENITLRRILRDYKEMLSDKTYRKYYALNLSGAFVSAALNASLVLFVYLTYGNIQNLILGFTLIFIVVNIKGAVEIGFFPVNVVLMKKFNKHRPYLLDVPLLIAAVIIIAFITPNTPIWVFIIACCMLGAGVSCLAFVPMTLLPDLADVDEVMYGKRREGTSAGLTTLGKKIVSGFALTVFGAILEAFGLDTSGASPETATTGSMIAIKIMLCGVPTVFCLAMLLISRTYALDKKSHDLIKSAITAKKENQTVSLSDEEKITLEKITGVKYEKLWISEDTDDSLNQKVD